MSNPRLPRPSEAANFETRSGIQKPSQFKVHAAELFMELSRNPDMAADLRDHLITFLPQFIAAIKNGTTDTLAGNPPITNYPHKEGANLNTNQIAAILLNALYERTVAEKVDIRSLENLLNLIETKAKRVEEEREPEEATVVDQGVEETRESVGRTWYGAKKKKKPAKALPVTPATPAPRIEKPVVTPKVTPAPKPVITPAVPTPKPVVVTPAVATPKKPGMLKRGYAALKDKWDNRGMINFPDGRVISEKEFEALYIAINPHANEPEYRKDLKTWIKNRVKKNNFNDHEKENIAPVFLLKELFEKYGGRDIVLEKLDTCVEILEKMGTGSKKRRDVIKLIRLNQKDLAGKSLDDVTCAAIGGRFYEIRDQEFWNRKRELDDFISANGSIIIPKNADIDIDNKITLGKAALAHFRDEKHPTPRTQRLEPAEDSGRGERWLMFSDNREISEKEFEDIYFIVQGITASPEKREGVRKWIHSAIEKNGFNGSDKITINKILFLKKLFDEHGGQERVMSQFDEFVETINSMSTLFSAYTNSLDRNRFIHIMLYKESLIQHVESRGNLRDIKYYVMGIICYQLRDEETDIYRNEFFKRFLEQNKEIMGAEVGPYEPGHYIHVGEEADAFLRAEYEVGFSEGARDVTGIRERSPDPASAEDSPPGGARLPAATPEPLPPPATVRYEDPDSGEELGKMDAAEFDTIATKFGLWTIGEINMYSGSTAQTDIRRVFFMKKLLSRHDEGVINAMTENYSKYFEKMQKYFTKNGDRKRKDWSTILTLADDKNIKDFIKKPSSIGDFLNQQLGEGLIAFLKGYWKKAEIDQEHKTEFLSKHQALYDRATRYDATAEDKAELGKTVRAFLDAKEAAPAAAQRPAETAAPRQSGAEATKDTKTDPTPPATEISSAPIHLDNEEMDRAEFIKILEYTGRGKTRIKGITEGNNPQDEDARIVFFLKKLFNNFGRTSIERIFKRCDEYTEKAANYFLTEPDVTEKKYRSFMDTIGRMDTDRAGMMDQIAAGKRIPESLLNYFIGKSSKILNRGATSSAPLVEAKREEFFRQNKAIYDAADSSFEACAELGKKMKEFLDAKEAAPGARPAAEAPSPEKNLSPEELKNKEWSKRLE